MVDRLFISFSGGETSAKMTRDLLTTWRNRYSDIVVGFANTAQEREETLEFIRECDEQFGFGTVWLEAVIHPEKGRGTTHRIIDFDTACRNGEPFEAMIRKFGVPNNSYPHCTRELKQRPMESYIRSLGWESGTYHKAIGIRSDEGHRRSSSAEKNGIVYPFLDWSPTAKPEVNLFWREQNWRLRLMGYQGNCRWCWKKSFRKHLTILDEDATVYDFPKRMEAAYDLVGPEFAKGTAPGYRRKFFRGNLSTKQLRELYEQEKDRFVHAENDAAIYEHQLVMFDEEPSDGHCTESCEVTWDEGEAV